MSTPILKLERANRHIDDLDALCKRFISEYPHRLLIEDDPKDGQIRIGIAVERRLPIETAAIIGDAVHNLRSALDHLAAEAIRRCGNIPTRDTQFPICGTPSELDGMLSRKLAGASEKFIRFVRELKPCRDGGDGVVFPLSRLDNIDKHSTQIASISIHCIHNVQLVASYPNGSLFSYRVGTMAVHNGSADLASIPPGAHIQLNPDTYPSFQMVFCHTGCLDGEPIVPTLQRFSERCGEIITNAVF